jgi:hypothetical protein
MRAGDDDTANNGSPADPATTVASETTVGPGVTTATGAITGPQQYAHSHAVASRLKHPMHGFPYT